MSDNNLQTPFPGLGRDELVKIGFFGQFAPEALEEIAPLVRALSLPADTTLFEHGDPYQGVIYAIRSGAVRQVWQNGKIAERLAGDVLGLSGYLDNHSYHSTATTLTDSEFAVLSAEELRRLERVSGSISDAMNRIIADHIRFAIPTRTNLAPLLSLSVSQAMKSPVVSCTKETTLHEAYVSMRGRRIGSLVVMDETNQPMGLLTRAELYEAALEKGLSGEDKVSSADCQRPCEIPSGASLQQAEDLQERKDTKHLIVTRDEQPVGILSQTDILRAVARVPPPLLAEIQRAEDFAALRRLHGRVPRFAAHMRHWNRSAMAAIHALNEAHRSILQRCVTLTLAEIAGRGKGAPPAPFALVILGSGGRGEMLLTPDQDNALILADEASRNASARIWFADFGDTLNRRMDQVGYALCPGGIMARNLSWRKGLSEWKQQFQHVITHPNPKAARWSNIILDFNLLYGEESLVLALRRHIAEHLRANPRLLRMMVEDDAQGRPPLGFFDRLITTTVDGKKHLIDVKRNALRLVADAGRVWAWREGVEVNNTSDRFRELARRGALPHELVRTALTAYDALFDLYLEQKLQPALAYDNDGGGALDDELLDRDRLDSGEQQLLRISLRAIKRLQKRLQEDFEVDA